MAFIIICIIRKLIAGQLDATPTAYIALTMLIPTHSRHSTVRFKTNDFY